MNILMIAASFVFTCTNSYYNADALERAYYEGTLDNGNASEFVNTNISSDIAWQGFQEYAEQIPKSGDLVQVGDFQYVILSRGDYDKLWGEMQEIKSMYNSLNSNETGRVTLHGKRRHVTVSTSEVQYEYADGYKHIEKIEPFKRPMSASPKAMRSAQATKVLSKFEKSREEMRKSRKMKLATTNEVTVTVGR